MGGLTVGAELAKRGFDVTLVSRGAPEDLGYDWTDSLDVPYLESIIGKKIPKEDFCYDDIVAFYTPAERVQVSNADAGPRTTTKMERRVFEHYLFEYARDCGVQFRWKTDVIMPLTDGDKVIGVRTEEGDIFADLVVDACGMWSPLRSKLPEALGIEKECAYGEAFYVYRAMYERNKLGEIPACPLEIYLLHLGEQGISWYCTREDEIDVLVGRFEPVAEETVERTLVRFEKTHPELTRKVKRAGDADYTIPIRRPLNRLVADGYAAIGDSAFMTLPMNGSGINFSLHAAMLLADVVSAAKDFSTESLWRYQREYFVNFGSNLAGVEAIKNALLGMKPEWVDFLFENRIITQKEMDSESGLKLGFGEIMGKAVRGVKNLPALLALVKGLAANGALVKHYAAVPETFTKESFAAWNEKAKSLVLPVKHK